MPEAVILSRCIFPPPDWVLSPAQSPSYPTPEKWRLGPENMAEQDPGRLTHKHIFILQLKFLRGSNLRDPIIGNFKEIKRTS